MPTILEQFREHTAKRPEHPAVHHRGRDVSYAQLAELVDGFARRLTHEGVASGDRVALLLANSIDYVVAYLGTWQAGGIVVGLNPESTSAELAATLGDCQPVAVVVEPKAQARLVRALDLEASPRVVYSTGDKPTEAAQPVPVASFAEACAGLPGDCTRPRPPQLDAIAQIIYTSGTTGRPKGVTLSHKNLAANCRSILDYLKLTPDDSVLVTLPFFYSYGNSLLFTHLAAGGRLVLAADTVFWNKALDLLQGERCTGFSGVPSTFAMLVHKSDFERREFPDLRYLTCAGGALAAPLVERVRAAVPRADLFLMYGQTEATARLSTLLPEDLDRKAGSIGRGIEGVTLEVLDESSHPVGAGEAGEVVARGDNIMAGYWNDPAATEGVLRPEGLRTGDQARVDEDGYLFIVGRKNDLIKYGAYRINPAEIEHVLLAVTGVAEAAVVGLPDELWGEVPVAFVVAAADQPPAERDLLEHCRRELPRYKQVREIRFVHSLPKTASGKIKRSLLREGAQSEAGGGTLAPDQP